MKERYLSLMEKALSAYSDAHIDSYFEKVKNEGLSEHGFARLTANMGILISHGRRTYLKERFVQMMDFCCANIYKGHAANDFAIRELVTCIDVLQKYRSFPEEKLEEWKTGIRNIDPYTAYDVIAKTPDEKLFNWALFSGVSEQMRQYLGLADTRDTVDTQIATQLRWFDENGMYRDNLLYAPMVYDIVPRGLFTMLLYFGYDGKYKDEIDAIIKKAALLSLNMQSVTGEIPFGGRSNQYMHNEAWLSAIFEYEATRYKKEGNISLASKFKAAASRALDNVEYWFNKDPIHHVKNRFPLETKYGCENYGYFDKYMITSASVLHDAYLVCDETVPVGELDTSPVIAETSDYFSKIFVRAGGYSLEFEKNSNPLYDCDGLGRVHKAGAPSPICLSVPCPSDPKYTIDTDRAVSASITPAVFINKKWVYATDHNAIISVVSKSVGDDSAELELCYDFRGGGVVNVKYSVNKNGVLIDAAGEDGIAFMLPAFEFDGEKYTEMTVSDKFVEIKYEGHICRYTTDGTLVDTKKAARNRNGHYRVLNASAKNSIKVKIEIT